MSSSNWFTGSGAEIDIKAIMTIIENHIIEKGRVFIGTDSMLKNDGCVFATAICLHGNKTSESGRYFFKRKRHKKSSYKDLKVRIMQEVSQSIEIGMEILECYPDAQVEIHVDIGSTERSKTRSLVDTMTGWATGAGFVCKIKPDAWASAAIADRHTK